METGNKGYKMVIEKISYKPTSFKRRDENNNFEKNVISVRKDISKNKAMLASALLCLAAAAKADTANVLPAANANYNKVIAEQVQPEKQSSNHDKETEKYLLTGAILGFAAGIIGQLTLMSGLYNKLQRENHYLFMKNIYLETDLDRKEDEIKKLKEENERMHKKLYPPTLEERRERVLKTNFKPE